MCLLTDVFGFCDTFFSVSHTMSVFRNVFSRQGKFKIIIIMLHNKVHSFMSVNALTNIEQCILSFLLMLFKLTLTEITKFLSSIFMFSSCYPVWLSNVNKLKPYCKVLPK